MSRTLSIHQEHEILLSLEKAGLNRDLAQKVANSPKNELAKEIVSFIASYGYEATIPQKKARRIMGNNFFGVKEAIRFHRVSPSKEDIAALSFIPFSEELLERVKETHLLIAVLPISIEDMQKRNPFLFFHNHKESETEWYSKQFFYPEKGKARWILLRKGVIPESLPDGSNNKLPMEFEQQIRLLKEDEEIPSARVFVYASIGYKLLTGEELLGREIYVRTSTHQYKDREKDGRICVSDIGPEGLQISTFYDHEPNISISSEIVVKPS